MPWVKSLTAIPRSVYGAGTITSAVFDGDSLPLDRITLLPMNPRDYVVLAHLMVYASDGTDNTLDGEVQEADDLGGPWDTLDFYPTVVGAPGPPGINVGLMYAPAVPPAHGGYPVLSTFYYGQAKRYIRAVLTIAGPNPAVDLTLNIGKIPWWDLQKGRVPAGVSRPWVPGGIGTPSDLRIGYEG